VRFGVLAWMEAGCAHRHDGLFTGVERGDR
jgi:hypothetical protein